MKREGKMGVSIEYYLSASLLLLTALPGLALGMTPSRDCGSWNGKLLKIDVEPCDEKICIFRKGENVTLQLDFVSGVEVLSSRIGLYGVTNPFFDIAFVDPMDFCTMDGITCPLQIRRVYSFSTSAYIDPLYPRMDAEIKLRIYSNELWRDILCVQVPIRIVA